MNMYVYINHVVSMYIWITTVVENISYLINPWIDYHGVGKDYLFNKSGIDYHGVGKD